MCADDAHVDGYRKYVWASSFPQYASNASTQVTINISYMLYLRSLALPPSRPIIVLVSLLSPRSLIHSVRG